MLTRRSFNISLVALAIFAVESFGQDSTRRRVIEERVVSLYSDLPAAGQADERSEFERYYEPYFYSPAAKASHIAVDPGLRASELDATATGTLVEIAVRWTGPNEFVMIGFVPAGATRLGAIPGMNVAELLGDARGHRIFLKLKARRPAGPHEVRCKFRVGGLAGNPHRDSLKFPATTRPELITLGESWQEISIELTDNAARLNQMLCPLSVVLESNDNPNARPQDGAREPTSKLYLDDIRFVAVREEPAR